MSLGRRLGRLARGFVSNVGDDRLRETVRPFRERGETLKSALGAAWRGAATEWRAAEERASREEEDGGQRASAGSASGTWRASSYSPPFVPRRFPPQVLYAYHRLGLNAGDPLEAVHKRRRELVKRHHPDRFVDPGQRARAERLTAEINAAHDVVERHLLRG